MTGRAVPEVVYRLEAPATGAWPGRHRSTSGDGGMEFRSHQLLADATDARRLDLLASLREPLGRWLVRRNSQRLAVPVVVLADLSASMAWQPPDGPPRMAVVADLVQALAGSAWKCGDSFGLLGAAQAPLPAFTLLPSRVRGLGQTLADRLRRHVPEGRSAQGLLQAAALLGRRRSLVFLVSDFHWPAALLPAVLGRLAHHQLVPVVLRHPAEAQADARQGLWPVQDAESGQRQLRWWRPALRQRWQAAWDDDQAALAQSLARHRCRPVWLAHGFDADALSRHFLA